MCAIMKSFFNYTVVLLLTIYLPACLSAQKQKPKKYTVSGKVTQTSSYCGGARPDEEMLLEAAKPKPYAAKVFYIRKGNENSMLKEIILKFETDLNGNFTIQLPQGIYSIIQSGQEKAFELSDYPSSEFMQVDGGCLKEWWRKPYYVLGILEKNIKGLKFNFHKRCFNNSDIPCIDYNGPMPP
jgi:hypothetical protein